MIQDWATFTEVFSLGLGAGFLIGLSALLVRFVRLSYVRWFKASANL